jgi:hypothetical protein
MAAVETVLSTNHSVFFSYPFRISEGVIVAAIGLPDVVWRVVAGCRNPTSSAKKHVGQDDIGYRHGRMMYAGIAEENGAFASQTIGSNLDRKSYLLYHRMYK